MSALQENYERMHHASIYGEDLQEDTHPHGIVAPGDFEDSPLDQLRDLQRQIEDMGSL